MTLVIYTDYCLQLWRYHMVQLCLVMSGCSDAGNTSRVGTCLNFTHFDSPDTCYIFPTAHLKWYILST